MAEGLSGPGRRLYLAAAAVGTWVIGALVFYRLQWGSGFQRLMGNAGDTRLAAYLCEHWFRVLHGQESWLSPPIFYPVRETLGWSDTFFLYQLFYAPLRVIGADPLLALQLTLMAMSLTAFLCFVLLVRLAFGSPIPVALVGGSIFVFGNVMWAHSSWAQLSGVYFVPPILLMGLCAWRLAGSGRWVAGGLVAALAGALWALLLFSTFYVAWFATLALVLVVLVLFLGAPRRSTRWVTAQPFRTLSMGAAAAAGFGLGILPFVRTYLSVPSTYHYGDAMRFSIKWEGLLSVGTGNFVWGRLVDQVVSSSGRSGELTFALTPILVVVTLGCGTISGYRLIRRRAANPAAARVTVALVLVAAFFTVAPVKSGFGSAWLVLWHIPGARAIRAIDRIEVVAALVAVLALAAAAGELSARPLSWRPAWAFRWAGGLLLALALVEQLNTGNNSLLSRPVQTAFMRSVTRPPPSCRLFYVVNSRTRLPYFDYQLDAMFVATRTSLPTINGYSGRFPPHWRLLSDSGPNYRSNARTWAVSHGVAAGLCQLDLGTMSWHLSPATKLSPRQGLSAAPTK